MIGDGQVTLGTTVAKSNAVKVRKLNDDIVAGFAGGAADAVALLDKLESMLNQYPGIYSPSESSIISLGQIRRACGELAKLWRTDSSLQKMDVRQVSPLPPSRLYCW